MYVNHKILQRIQALVLLFENETTSDYTRLIIEFNKLDDEKNRYARAAENHCNWSPPQGAYAWSPKLEKAGQTITYWKSRLSRLHIPVPHPPFELSIETRL